LARRRSRMGGTVARWSDRAKPISKRNTASAAGRFCGMEKGPESGPFEQRFSGTGTPSAAAAKPPSRVTLTPAIGTTARAGPAREGLRFVTGWRRGACPRSRSASIRSRSCSPPQARSRRRVPATAAARRSTSGGSGAPARRPRLRVERRSPRLAAPRHGDDGHEQRASRDGDACNQGCPCHRLYSLRRLRAVCHYPEVQRPLRIRLDLARGSSSRRGLATTSTRRDAHECSRFP
jgi:hypothetical protein